MHTPTSDEQPIVNNQLREFAKDLTPPFIWKLARKARSIVRRSLTSAENRQENGGKRQELDIYWDPKMAEVLETWGEGNAWHEIRLLLVRRHGKVLDIACGTGRVMTIVQKETGLDVHGCDISDFLISKAVHRGLKSEKLLVCDATNMPYEENLFEYAYSIGSLEHFTQEGIDQVFNACKRVVNNTSFHMIPVSRSGKDEGWITPYQAYFNNSVGWWTRKAEAVFQNVEVLDSLWEDDRSVGRWLVCSR